MNANAHQFASIELASPVSTDYVDEELQRYDAYGIASTGSIGARMPRHAFMICAIPLPSDA